jgi:hypothetical protein
LDGQATPGWELQGNLRLPHRNHQEISDLEIPFATERGAAPSVNLLNMKEPQKPKQVRKNLWRRSPYGPFGYLVTFSPDRHTNKRRIAENWPQQRTHRFLSVRRAIGLDVLVEPQHVVWVVLFLDLHEAGIVRPVA